ncbi:MAG: hypothetical protein LBL47_02085 [Lactobacillus sp.]|jgi:flavodoxin|nr:hypothetical protein [Lactobacillus sp.]
MFKYIIYIVLVAIVAGLVIGGFHLYRVSARNKNEMSKFSGKKVDINKDLGKVLVVYYSLSGRTKDIAMRIKNKTNADVYEIKTLEPMPKGPKLHFAIKEQLKSKQYPAIATDFPAFEEYDTIFVGGPVWWYTAATPLLSFLTEADFNGKKVVPFSTQGSNVGTFFEDFNKTIKNANIQTSERFNNLSKEYDIAVDNKISSWLNNL